MIISLRPYYLTTFILGLMLLLGSCASTGNPNGGPKDTTPPELTDKSTPSEQTNFTKQDLEFYFDEFVNVVNPAQQVLVSPPLVYPLQFEHRGKRLKVKFHEDEVLKEDVTYSINFGEAIEDFREKNKMNNFQFVFSTGDVLDSLTFTGKVTNAVDQSAAKDVLVMLYDTLYNDSIPYLSKPYYFAKTAEDGTFTIKNIKNDTFKIVALKDENLNYLLDEGAEWLGYTDSLYIITDYSLNHIDLEIWPTDTNPILTDDDSDTRGILYLEFDPSSEHVTYEVSDPSIDIVAEYDEERLSLFYPLSQDSTFYVYVLSDTIRVNPMRSKEEPESLLELADNNANLSQGILAADSILLKFNTPISQIDTNLISMYKTRDTLRQDIGGWNAAISKDLFGVQIWGNWSTNDTLTVSVDSAAIQDMYDASNDSLGFVFRIDSKENRSELELSLSQIDSLYDYIVVLYQGEKEILKRKLNTENPTTTLQGLRPGTYEVEILEDRNKNGQWDTGNYLNGTFPERRRKQSLEELRANWEVKTNINWLDIVTREQ